MEIMLKGKKAVIFDMDGVLVDSEKFWKQAEFEVFSGLGAEVTDEWCRHTQSMTTKEVTQFWYGKFPWRDKSLDDVEQLVINKVISLIATEDCTIEGIKDFIEKLKTLDLKIGLATNSPGKIIPVVLEATGTTHLFDTVSSAESEIAGKPNPAIYLTTAKKLNVKPGECLVIEDSISGMEAAKKAGMTIVAFTNGDEGLSFEIADYKISIFNFESPTF